jgi:hypothetical protein
MAVVTRPNPLYMLMCGGPGSPGLTGIGTVDLFQSDGLRMAHPSDTPRGRGRVPVRAIKTSVISMLAIGLLAGSAVGVAAQGDEAAAVFEWSTAPGEVEGTAIVEATDTRATGVLNLGLGEAFVTDDVIIASVSGRLVNDGGSWMGTGRSYGGNAEDQDQVVWELLGADGYDGLMLFMFDGGSMWGIIVPADAVPPYPEPPTVE